MANICFPPANVWFGPAAPLTHLLLAVLFPEAAISEWTVRLLLDEGETKKKKCHCRGWAEWFKDQSCLRVQVQILGTFYIISSGYNTKRCTDAPLTRHRFKMKTAKLSCVSAPRLHENGVKTTLFGNGVQSAVFLKHWGLRVNGQKQCFLKTGALTHALWLQLLYSYCQLVAWQ